MYLNVFNKHFDRESVFDNVLKTFVKNQEIQKLCWYYKITVEIDLLINELLLLAILERLSKLI